MLTYIIKTGKSVIYTSPAEKKLVYQKQTKKEIPTMKYLVPFLFLLTSIRCGGLDDSSTGEEISAFTPTKKNPKGLDKIGKFVGMS